jgi:hypothetical protein
MPTLVIPWVVIQELDSLKVITILIFSMIWFVLQCLVEYTVECELPI